MDYQNKIFQLLSTGAGTVRDVYYEVYKIIEALDDEDQGKAVRFVCENSSKIQTDSSVMIKRYYTDEQSQKVSNIFYKTKLGDMLFSLITQAAKMGMEPDSFYQKIWSTLKQKYKTKRERALVLYELTQNTLIPYRPIGTGLTMSDNDYKDILTRIGQEMLEETDYILKIDYEQKTQYASLLLDRLLRMDSYEEQTVYMTMIISIYGDMIRERIKDRI